MAPGLVAAAIAPWLGYVQIARRIMGEKGTAGILVVDDDPLIRRAVGRVLRPLRLPIREAADGAVALELIEADPPALLITDYSMPGMTGRALAEAVAARHPEIPIVLHSGNAMQELPGEWWPDFDLTLVAKPASSELLLEVVTRSLSGTEAGRPRTP